MRLFETKSSYEKPNAQQNLSGRTHYVDDDTLRFHHARILRAGHVCGGLLFYIVESTAMDPDNRRRGYRGVVFDLFGTVVNARAKLEDCCTTRKAAERIMWAEINAMDAVALNLKSLEHERKWQTDEWARMEREILAWRDKVAA